MSTRDASGLNILVVDDNDLIRNVLIEELAEAGFDATGASDGDACLEAVESSLPALIVLDVNMPRMDGIQVVEALRQRYSRAELPIVMATAVADSEDVVRALDAGANDYVTKPIELPILLARVRSLLATRNAVSQTKPTSGQFKELSARDEPSRRRGTRNCDQWCPSCFTIAAASARVCADCGRERPHDGWPDIPRDEHPFLGRTIGRGFYLDRAIGRGGSGSIYRALELDIERHFVAKVLHLAPSDDPSHDFTREQIITEVRALAKLHSPHIVEVLEFFMADERYCVVVMEYLEGLDLATALEQYGALPARMALDIVRQIASGLHVVHEAGLVHCDIKPSNVMLQSVPGNRYFATLVDFGIARSARSDRRVHVFKGTPAFAAPEQFFGDSGLDPRTDIYSLGLVLHAALTGVRVYSGTHFLAIAAQKANAPTNLIEFVPDTSFSRDLDALVNKMTAPVASERIESASAVVDALEALLQDPQLSEFQNACRAHRPPCKWEDPTVVPAIPQAELVAAGNNAAE